MRGNGYRGKYKAYDAIGDENNFFKYIDLAIKDFEAAAKIAPDANYQKGAELLSVERDDRKKANDSKKASAYHFQRMIENADKAIQLNPKDAQAYRDRAAAYGILGNSMRSVEDFTVSITLSPNCGAYIGRGFEYGKAGDTKKAIEDFEMAVKLDPDSDSAKRSLQEARDGTMIY